MLMTMPKVAQRKLGYIGELPAARNELPHQPALPPGVAPCLAERLRAYYAHLMNDPVPDAFIQVLEAMDGAGSANNGR